MDVFGYFFQKEHMLMAHQQKRSTSTEDFGGGGGEGGAAASVPTAPENLLLFASFISQFTASMLGSKVHLAPPMVKHNGRANSKIGYSVFIFVYFKA